jgi:LVIVD repeat
LRLTAVLVLVLGFSVAGCAGHAWKQARSEDSVIAYHRFLKEYPDSDHAQEARARMAFARVRAKPTREGFDAFRKQFADSPLVDELRPFVEESFFTEARARGTAQAYRDFLEAFGGGAYDARARGNEEYLEHGGFGGRTDALADFAARHPESDYAAEAQRSVAAVATRGKTAFRRIALLLDVPSATPGADRLTRVYSERALSSYARVGIQVVPVSGPEDPRLAELPVRITISHREQSVRPELEAGQVESGGIQATVVVTVSRAGDEQPIWRDSFEFRAGSSESKPGESILFSAGRAPEFWNRFFVPVATWDTRAAARDPRPFDHKVADVELSGSRAIVVFDDGDLQILDLGDPASPALLGEYHRPKDLAHFSGVRALRGEFVIFGPDGMEIVRSGPQGVARSAVYGRDAVGSIVAVEALGSGLVAASNRGLLWQPADGQPFAVLVRRDIRGLARIGDRLAFTDGETLWVTPLNLLRAGRVESDLRIGQGFGVTGLRANGPSLVVLGERGVVWVDVSQPARLRVVSRIETTEAGEIDDATVVGERLFLLGPRGLQVADPSGERVVDSVDVLPRQHLAATGRHLVAVDAGQLQVVDATPFLTTAAASAAPR